MSYVEQQKKSPKKSQYDYFKKLIMRMIAKKREAAQILPVTMNIRIETM
ncbi:MAG: hypothetical protein RIM83_08485 [Allomuricauda sp.]